VRPDWRAVVVAGRVRLWQWGGRWSPSRLVPLVRSAGIDLRLRSGRCVTESYWILQTGRSEWSATPQRRARRHARERPSRSAPVADGRVGYEGRIRAGPLPYRRQAGRHRRFCSWCLVATAATLAAVPLVVPDVRAAWRVLRTGRDR